MSGGDGRMGADKAALIERLANHRTLGGVPRNELEWLAAHGRVGREEAGTVLYRKGTRLEEMFVLFTGHFGIVIDRGAGPRQVMEWGAGDVAGLLPYSRMTGTPGESVIHETIEFLGIHRDDFRELTRECPEVSARLVHVMLDRARVFKSIDLHDEKMMSLGRLAAGLAHELNNPASAAARSSKLLADALIEADSAARSLGAANLSAEQLEAIERVRTLCLSTPTVAGESPLDRADREDAIGDWLDVHGADDAAAAPLSETALTVGALDELAARLSGDELDAALRWIAQGCIVRGLARDVETAATRVHTLVTAVKKFTYMDRPTAPELVDIGQGINDTMPMLRAKARAKSAEVSVDLEASLPPVLGFGGELNQVWMNLIDNALDAIGPSGHVTVRAEREHGRVVVRVVDDGPGIPAAIRDRIFDAFFTTKPVGQGTGLGLEIVRRLVEQHRGLIAVDSQPGHTEFRVSLPVANEGERAESGAQAANATT